jgi:peptide subunit release factor 1 (eRF1)
MGPLRRSCGATRSTASSSWTASTSGCVAAHGRGREDYELAPAAIPTAHDVQAGGYSHKDYQKRKAEEARQFFKDFADEIGRFHERSKPDHYVLLGTTENTQHFREFLPKSVTERIIHTAHAPPARRRGGHRRHLQPIIDEIAAARARRRPGPAAGPREPVALRYVGMHDTLEQLQEGKVDRLVVSRDLEKDGVQCTQCAFYLVRRDGACPYCGGSLRCVDLAWTWSNP